MNNTSKQVVIAAVVALVVSLLAGFAFVASTPDSPDSSQNLSAIQGTVLESPYVFRNGHGDGGDNLTFTANGEISAGQNQGAWRNTTGRTVFVDLAATGFTSGTASSSMTIFAATSSASTLSSDFDRPGGEYLLIDGANFATSTTGNRIFTSTSTPDGNAASFPVASGEYVVFQYQETYDCVSIGACETATSTNRGVSAFFWYLKAHYKP